MAPSSGDDAQKISRRASQLAFDLAPAPAFEREDFFISGSNEQAYTMIELWPDWPDPMLLIIGPPGSGKSHLGAIWSSKAKAHIISAHSLVKAELGGLAAGPLLVENLEAAVHVQAQLFHLINLMRERGTSLVLTAREPPENCGLTIADLRSRLRLASRVGIGPPDDALMRAVLVKLLIDRQLVVDTGLVDYAAVRLERSLAAAQSFVGALDRHSLARKTRVTRALALEVMNSMAWTDVGDLSESVGTGLRGNDVA